MKTLLVSAALVCASGAAHGAPYRLTELRQQYLDGLFRAKPHLATFMGDHRFDEKLVDLGAEALKQREAELAALQKKLDALKPSLASTDEKVDGEILADGIGLELLYLREIRDWEWDPRLFDSFPYYDPREIVAGRLSDIIHGDFAPEAERRRSVVAQLAALPKLVEQEKAALDRSKQKGARRVSKEYADQAIKGNQGRIEFFDSEVREFCAKDPKAEAARVKAVAALKDYQKYLEQDLKPRADGDWRLGAALYRKKFPLALQTSLTADEMVARAEASFKRARAELYAAARGLHKTLWPAAPQPAENADAQAQKKIIEKVKDELAKDHPKPDDLVASHARNLDALRGFIEKHDLLALPPRETLVVEPMPAFKRGSSAAEYLAPGVLDRAPKWHATYYVDPIDPTWPAERVESYLRGQNSYEVQLVAAHEAYPGHHTQYFYSKRNLNPLRAVLWNAPMVEGWAVYGEGLMVGLGWGDAKNARFHFYDVRGQMIVATNALLDVKLQSGTMSDAEAVRFMVEEGFQEQAMAEKKLLRAKLDSTQLAQYFLGLEEIRDLERDYRKKVGGAFTQRKFNEALIGQGSVAVKFLRRYLLE
ncbi:MAG TPA: DUF885 domain-containing protein [Polyangia bacterium]|nr:DUF885 domain-containing protein [Polyangia bacterium]